MDTLERLQTLIAAQRGIPPEALGPDATLESLGIDSLGLIELAFEVEDSFGVKIDEVQAATLRTVGEFAAHVDQLRAASAA